MHHQYTYIPHQAFLYFPTKNQIKYANSRKIFQGNIPFDTQQQKHLLEFQKYLTKKKIKIDQFWNKHNRVRFLQSCAYNYQKTVQHMKDYITWRNANIPPKLTSSVEKYLKSGIFYFSGRDSKYKPIMIFDIKKIIDLKMQSTDLTLTLTYFINYMIENFLISGQIENWVVIIDLNFINIFSLVGTLRQCIGFLSNTFRCRMYRCYLVNTPTSISFGWGMVKNFLQEQTIKKISFYSTNIAAPLFEQTNKSQIEKKYGGNAEEIKQFWPIKIMSKQYFIGDSLKNLISENEYRNLYQKNELKDRKMNMKIINVKEQKKGEVQKKQNDKYKIQQKAQKQSQYQKQRQRIKEKQKQKQMEKQKEIQREKKRQKERQKERQKQRQKKKEKQSEIPRQKQRQIQKNIIKLTQKKNTQQKQNFNNNKQKYLHILQQQVLVEGSINQITHFKTNFKLFNSK